MRLASYEAARRPHFVRNECLFSVVQLAEGRLAALILLLGDRGRGRQLARGGRSMRNDFRVFGGRVEVKMLLACLLQAWKKSPWTWEETGKQALWLCITC